MDKQGEDRMLTKERILEILKEAGVLLEGHFLLTSGRHSEKYLQCANAGRDDMEFEEYERTGTGRTSDLHNEGGDRGFRSVS